MTDLPSLNELIEHLKRMPGVGQKSAERMAQALLTFNEETLYEIGNAIISLPKKIKICTKCGLYSENELCSYCLDAKRNSDTLIVISRFRHGG